MGDFLLLLSLIVTVTGAQIPNANTKLISQGTSFDIYTIKNTANSYPRGIPDYGLLPNELSANSVNSNNQNEFVKGKLLRSLLEDNQQDLGEGSDLEALMLLRDKIEDTTPNPNAKNTTVAPNKVAREKVYQLLKYANAQMEDKLKVLGTVHNTYKHNKLYKLGYIVSYINKSKENMSNLYKYIEKKKGTWKFMTLLDAYAQITKNMESLTDMVTVLNTIVPTHSLVPLRWPPKDSRKTPFSYSYYDDST